MPSRIRTHVRSNLVGYLALFVALGGTAAGLPGRNTVDSGDIKNANVKSVDIKDNTLKGADVRTDTLAGSDIKEGSLDTTVLQRRVSAGCAAGRAIRSISQNGTVTCVNVSGY